MSGYDDDNETNLVEDEYDDLDDFIVGSDDEGDNVAEEEEELPEAEEVEVEEEYEEEEEEEPPVGTQEILSFREQLKAKLRKQHQSSGADADGNPSCSSSDQPSVRSRFGTFFGPSTPVLAPRLMEAGCSSMMKENQDVPSRKHAASSLASKMQQSASTHEQKPKIVPQVKRKVDTLRENRDYSNLFSDDADTPPLTKEDAEKKPVMDPKSDVEVHRMKAMQSTARNNKVPTNHTARPSKDHGSIKSRVENKVFSQVKKEPLPNGRKPIASARNGSRPANGKARPGLQPSSNGQNPQRSIQSKSPQMLPASQRQQQQRRPLKPQGPRQQNHVPPSPQVRRTNLSMQGQQPAHKGSALPRDRTKLGQKQLAPSSRPKPSPTSAVYGGPAKKKGVVKRKVSEAEKVRQMVRDVLNYDPGKYSHKDKDNDSDMEADYASIQMEERRSAKIARKEDEEEYRLLQEEEQRERAKKKKQRKES